MYRERKVEIPSEVVVLDDGSGAVEAVDSDEPVARHRVVSAHDLCSLVAYRYAGIAIVADDVVLEDDPCLGADHDAIGAAAAHLVVEERGEAALRLHVDSRQQVPVHIVIFHP